MICLSWGPVSDHEWVNPLIQVITVWWPKLKVTSLAASDGITMGETSADAPMERAIMAMAQVMAVASKCLVAVASSFHNGGSVAAVAIWVRRRSISSARPHFPSGMVLVSSNW
jgi:hypothetical protein